MTPQERNACEKREGDGVRSFFLPPTAKGWGLTPDGVCPINRGGTGHSPSRTGYTPEGIQVEPDLSGTEHSPHPERGHERVAVDCGQCASDRLT